MHNQQRYQTVKMVAYISAILNSLLALIKIFIGFFGHSHALVADGLHSFSDLLTDGLILLGAKLGNRSPDQEHPYGHHRIETIAAILIAFMLLLVGAAIVYGVFPDVFAHVGPPMQSIPVMLAAVIAILTKEGLYRFTLHQGKKISSNLLISNAYHHRSDALTSLIVLISALGTLLGLKYLDAVGAIVIALLIAKMGLKMLWFNLRELIDTGVDEKTLSDIVTCIKETPGVVGIHQLRTRLHGGRIFVDVHLLVDPFISVSEGHFIGEQVHKRLLDNFNSIADVTEHIDPEDDETSHPSLYLPSREKILNHLQEAWPPSFKTDVTKKINLHYVNGKLHIEIMYHDTPLSAEEQQQLTQALKKAMQKFDYIRQLEFFFRSE